MDSDAAALLDLMAKHAPLPGPGVDLKAYRAAMTATAQRGDPLAIGRVEDVALPAGHGEVRARFYADGPATAPLLLFFHGGGWAICDIDTHDDFCRRLSRLLGWQILSVDYRLAPEHPFPAAFDDGYAALEWASGAGAASLGIAPAALIVGGDSAGGTIAAGLCFAALDRGGPRIDHQLLLYPALDPRLETPSARANGEGYHLTLESLGYLWGLYLNGQAADPYAAPALRADLSGLPPATIVTAGYDPLRDEGRDYAERLEAAGVPVDYRCFDGTIHGFALAPHLGSAQQLMVHLKKTLDAVAGPAAG